MIAMPFYQKFDEASRDRQRAERLLEELPGIFNWALEGARRLYAQERFSECTVCGACLNEYMLNSDPFRQFVDEQVEFAPDAEIAKDEAYRGYRDYCDRNGYYAKSKSEFGKQMCLLDGVTAGRSGSGNRAWTYRGVKLVKREYFVSSSVTLPPESPADRRSSRGFSPARRPTAVHSPCEAA
jgi:putative DNA primase/helicase